MDREDGCDEDEDGPVVPNWEPASRDADPASGSRGGGDILSMLVSIYGSKVIDLSTGLVYWSELAALSNHREVLFFYSESNL